MFVLHINGPPGSGKTTLGRALARAVPGVRHIELDDVARDALLGAGAHAAHTQQERTELRRRELRRRLRALPPRTRAVVLTGWSIGVDHLRPARVWLRVDDLAACYRRVVAREVDKVRRASVRRVADVVRDAPVGALDRVLATELGLLGPLPLSYRAFADLHDRYFAHARGRGLVVERDLLSFREAETEALRLLVAAVRRRRA